MSKHRRKAVVERDFSDCKSLWQHFDNAFGTDGRDTVGADGHLWMMIPISPVEAKNCWSRVGMKRQIGDAFQIANSEWKFHIMLYKYGMGFFRSSIWLGSIYLMHSGQQCLMGFLSNVKLSGFRSDLESLRAGLRDTFESADIALETPAAARY